MADNNEQDGEQGGSEGTSRSHALRTCFMDEHDGRSGRITACFVASLGVILAIGGTISLLTNVPRILPMVDAIPVVMEEDVGFFQSLGVLVIGLALIGRKRLADRIISVGRNVRSLLSSS